MKNIYFLIVPKTHPLDIIGPAQLFYECKDNGADLNLFFVSTTESTELDSSLGLGFSKLTPYQDLELKDGDTVVIPGIEFDLLTSTDFRIECQPFYRWLRTQYANGVTMVSVCTGAFLLGESGLLKGKKATTHWKSFDTFEEKFPDTQLLKNKLFVENKQQRIYTPQFILICFSSLFFSASYNMLIPELPSYLSSLGGAEYKGFIIALFTITAGLSRPFSGKLTDTIGRKPVLIFGAIVCIVSGVLYPILTSVSGFLFLRLVHGFSTGFSPTAIAAYVSDIIPNNRLGEAMGIQGLCFSTGLALGPALGSYIKLYTDYNVLFYSSSMMAVISIILVIRVKETLAEKQSFKIQTLRISTSDVIAKEALPAALITFITYVGFGVVLTLIPDWSDHLGILNKGTFFIAFTISSVFVRIIAGKLSDKYGRNIIIKIGLIILIIALFLLGFLETKCGLLISAVVYGLAMGIISPTVNAWTIDLSNPLTKGKSIATMYIALEAGIGLGALFSGWYYQDVIENISSIFYACAIVGLIGVIYMVRMKENNE